MPIVIREIHAPQTPDALNDEWFVIENTGEKAFSTAGCAVQVGKGNHRLKPLGTLDPGFTMAPAEKVRIITGNPAKKAHGTPPEPPAGLKNYHLFSGLPLLSWGPGTVVAMSLKQHELVRAIFDPKAKSGVAAE